ncbi:MAG: hypothetical protein HY902_01575 [Deltaproteobacteria bacterium]|nr:hypothetical protein [Deltaproteobacteria bacterium]
MKTRWAAVLFALAASCGAADGQRSPPNPQADRLRADLRAANDKPIVARWNPAPCACPPFEVLVGATWVRADFVAADPEPLVAWQAYLAATPTEALPVPLQVEGRIERQLLRTSTGAYAVRVEVAAVLGPRPLEPSPTPTPGPAAP